MGEYNKWTRLYIREYLKLVMIQRIPGQRIFRSMNTVLWVNVLKCDELLTTYNKNNYFHTRHIERTYKGSTESNTTPSPQGTKEKKDVRHISLEILYIYIYIYIYVNNHLTINTHYNVNTYYLHTLIV